MNGRSKIKLLIFTPTLQCGGSEKFVSILCGHINTDKFLVCLAVLNNVDPFYNIENKNIEIIDLKKSRVRSSLFTIRAVVKKYQPDIILSTANHLNLYFAIFRNWFPKQIKFLARESSIVSINSQRATMPWLYNRMIKKYYRRFDHILCQGVYMLQDLAHHYKIPAGKMTVICNATQEWPAIPATYTTGNVDKTYKLITVARLSEEKGIERLIHAVGLLSLPYKFYIIGKGEQKNRLHDLINELHLQENVFLEGEKADPFSGMEDADLFLMGSYYEGFPNVLPEAGMLGIPVVAFNVPGGIPEIITDGENGLLVDDNDILGFAAAVKRGLTIEFNRNLIIENTRKRFSVDIMISGVENLLMQL